jgi:hypothetical protein
MTSAGNRTARAGAIRQRSGKAEPAGHPTDADLITTRDPTYGVDCAAKASGANNNKTAAGQRRIGDPPMWIANMGGWCDSPAARATSG